MSIGRAGRTSNNQGGDLNDGTKVRKRSKSEVAQRTNNNNTINTIVEKTNLGSKAEMTQSRARRTANGKCVTGNKTRVEKTPINELMKQENNNNNNNMNTIKEETSHVSGARRTPSVECMTDNKTRT